MEKASKKLCSSNTAAKAAKSFIIQKAPNVGRAMQCQVPTGTGAQRCSAPLPTAISLSACPPSLALLSSQGPTAGTHLSCLSSVSHQASSSGHWGSPVFLEQAQGSQAELTTKHGAEWDPGAQPAPSIHPPAPCPCASPSWGTSCPCRGRGRCRLADGHQGSVPLFQDTAIRPGAQIGEGAGALPTLSGGGSGERTESHAGPAKLCRRALG